MRRISVVLFSAVLLAILAGAVVSAHEDHRADGHHPNGGNTGIRHCFIGTGFQDYGSGHVTCNASSYSVSQHHGDVYAALPSGASYTGGFCVKADIPSSGDILRVNYNDVAEFDTVWLKSNDGNYYPCDWTPGEATINIEDAGWSDMDSTPAKIEAEILFSRSSSDNSSGLPGNSDSSVGSGGGCDSLGGLWAWLGVIPGLPLILARKRGEQR